MYDYMNWQGQTVRKQQALRDLIAKVHPDTLARLIVEVYSVDLCIKLADRIAELVWESWRTK